MKVELYYDSKRFVFRLMGVDIGYAPFCSLMLKPFNRPTEAEVAEMMWLLSDYMPGEVLQMVGAKGVILGPKRPFTHELTLHACGNPDHRQFSPIAPNKTVRVCGVGNAAKVLKAYQDNYEIVGAGNCGKNHGKVWLLPSSAEEKRKLVGYVYYNGRFETVAERKACDKMIKEKYKTKLPT